MKLLRHLLFIALLLLVQSGAVVHATGHLRPDVDSSASHSCALCIAAQGIDAPLVSVAASVPLAVADFLPTPGLRALTFAPLAISPCARAPPFA